MTGSSRPVRWALLALAAFAVPPVSSAQSNATTLCPTASAIAAYAQLFTPACTPAANFSAASVNVTSANSTIGLNGTAANGTAANATNGAAVVAAVGPPQAAAWTADVCNACVAAVGAAYGAAVAAAAPPNATNASVSLLLAVCAATDVPLLLNSSAIDQKAFAACVAGANLTTTSTTSTDAAGLANATETLIQDYQAWHALTAGENGSLSNASVIEVFSPSGGVTFVKVPSNGSAAANGTASAAAQSPLPSNGSVVASAGQNQAASLAAQGLAPGGQSAPAPTSDGGLSGGDVAAAVICTLLASAAALGAAVAVRRRGTKQGRWRRAGSTGGFEGHSPFADDQPSRGVALMHLSGHAY